MNYVFVHGYVYQTSRLLLSQIYIPLANHYHSSGRSFLKILVACESPIEYNEYGSSFEGGFTDVHTRRHVDRRLVAVLDPDGDSDRQRHRIPHRAVLLRNEPEPQEHALGAGPDRRDRGRTLPDGASARLAAVPSPDPVFRRPAAAVPAFLRTPSQRSFSFPDDIHP